VEFLLAAQHHPAVTSVLTLPLLNQSQQSELAGAFPRIAVTSQEGRGERGSHRRAV